MFKFISIIFFIILFAFKANAAVVNDIKVINNERVSKETILIFSKIKLGKDYSQK
jgi:Outer membrane protein/protective antigen OMA87